DQGIEPNLVAGQVYQLSEFQLTPITDPDTSLSYKRSGANSRLIWGRNAMLSFIRMDPHSFFPIHNHPEDQLMTVLRGTLTESVTWLKGKLYFSDMYFKDPAKGDWTGSPARSRLIVMEPDGKWKVLAKGMQTNGTIASKDGKLVVCDMFGHRVIEVDPASGK